MAELSAVAAVAMAIQAVFELSMASMSLLHLVAFLVHYHYQRKCPVIYKKLCVNNCPTNCIHMMTEKKTTYSFCLTPKKF